MFPEESAIWPTEIAISFLNVCRNTLTLPVKRDIEKRVRSGSGTEHKGWRTTCSSEKGDTHGQLIHRFKKESDDELGSLLDSLLSDNGLQMIMVHVAERAASVLKKVKKNVEKNETLLEAEERQIRQEILKESLIRETELQVSQEVTRKYFTMSRAGGLFANPSALRGTEFLNALHPETIHDLMKKGYGVQFKFVGNDLCQKVYEEMEFLEYNGSFNEMLQPQFQGIRNDHTCWFSSSDLDRFKQRGLKTLFEKMSFLPYELNKKANLGLQMSWMFLLSYYSDKGTFYTKHMDNSYQEEVDNGRKITCIYYPNCVNWKKSDDGFLRMFERQSRAMQNKVPIDLNKFDANSNFIDINPQEDCLVIFRSRDMPHEILPNYTKRFAVTLWISGPAGPGDD